MHQTCTLCFASHGNADALCVPCRELTDWFGSLSVDQQWHLDQAMVEYVATLEENVNAGVSVETSPKRVVASHTLNAGAVREPRRAA